MFKSLCFDLLADVDEETEDEEDDVDEQVRIHDTCHCVTYGENLGARFGLIYQIKDNITEEKNEKLIDCFCPLHKPLLVRLHCNHIHQLKVTRD